MPVSAPGPLRPLMKAGGLPFFSFSYAIYNDAAFSSHSIKNSRLWKFVSVVVQSAFPL